MKLIKASLEAKGVQVSFGPILHREGQGGSSGTSILQCPRTPVTAGRVVQALL